MLDERCDRGLLEIRTRIESVTSRRGGFKIFEDRLEYGDCAIPYSDIEAAELYQTKFLFIPCFILKLRTADDTFQSGLSGNKYWKGELPFEVTRSKGRLKQSMVSIALRVALVAMIAWYFSFVTSDA
jgi:hypothetical protein